MSKIVLHNYFRSSASWRVRIGLALKGIKYEYRSVSLIQDGGEQHKDDFVAISPMHQVPVLEVDGVFLTQSLPILEYLEETHPTGVSLFPKDPIKRAQSRAIAEIINSGIQPLQNLSVLNALTQDKGEWAKRVIAQGFVALEKALQQTSGKCCVGDEISIADLCLVPQVFNAIRFKVDLTSYPLITKINAFLETQPAFAAAHPKQQPDCPDSEK